MTPIQYRNSRKVVGKMCTRQSLASPVCNMGYNQCNIPDIVAVEPTFDVFF